MAEPVVVLPIPAEASSTLKLNKWYAIWTTVGALAVTALDFAVNALADPSLVPVIERFIPDVETRIIVVAIVGFLARQNWTKRMNTAQPIIGSPGEARAFEESPSFSIHGVGSEKRSAR